MARETFEQKLKTLTDSDIEKSFLACIFFKDEYYAPYFSTIEEKMFSLYPNKKIYECIKELYSQGNTITADIVWMAIEKHGYNNTFLTKDVVEYTANGCSDYINPENISYYAKQLQDRYVARETIKQAEKLIEKSSSGRMSANEIINMTSNMALNLSNKVTSESEIKQVGIDSNKMIEDIREKVESDSSVLSGFTTCLQELDSVTHGFQRGRVTCILGGNSCGKSLYMLQVILANAKRGNSAFIGSFEMSNSELSLRLCCMLTGLDSIAVEKPKVFISKGMASGHFSTFKEGLEYIENKLKEGEKALSMLPIYIYEQDGATIDDFKGALDRHVIQIGTPDIVVIDHAELLVQSQLTLVPDLYSIYTKSKNIAKKLDCAVLALHQFSNNVKNNKNFRSTIFDCKGGKASQDNSDLIMTIYRSDIYQSLKDEEDYVPENDITVEKIRYSKKPSDRIPFEFTSNGFKDLGSKNYTETSLDDFEVDIEIGD